MRVLILGGDGYLGWPTAMDFSAKGHEVCVIDNYLRRNVARETSSEALMPNPNLHDRADIFHSVAGKQVDVRIGDCTDYRVMAGLVKEFKPDAVVHYAEQPSAPYSMRGFDEASRTLHNNLGVTFNVIWAVLEHAPDCHIIKLGTMGEYGTPNIDIEEGWINITHNGRSDRLPYPKLPASLYHCSKVHDSTNIEFCCRTWGLRATDLNQGVVYGIETEETRLDPRLATRFDYDETWGTALNRFCVQAVIGHPLTPYGKGNQCRGFLNIVDTLRCVELACLNPPVAGEFRVFNQFTEQFSINQLAELVQAAGHEVGLAVEILHIENPRVEKEEHYYNAKHTKLLDLGLEPHLLSDTLVEHMFDVIARYQHRIIPDHIVPRTSWRTGYPHGVPAAPQRAELVSER